MTRWQALSKNREVWIIAALAGAWVGLWGAWIAHTSVALTQNAFYLSEWATYLQDVRYGGLKAFPDVMRLSAALGTLALAVELGSIRNSRLRWAARLAAAPVGLILLPPYPDVFSLWWSPSYGGRFAAASVLWIGLAACWLIDRLDARVRRWSVVGCAGGAMIAGGWSFAVLVQPFQAHYAAPLLPGWGLTLFLAGLALAAIIQLSLLIPSAAGAPNKRGHIIGLP